MPSNNISAYNHSRDNVVIVSVNYFNIFVNSLQLQCILIQCQVMFIKIINESLQLERKPKKVSEFLCKQHDQCYISMMTMNLFTVKIVNSNVDA